MENGNSQRDWYLSSHFAHADAAESDDERTTDLVRNAREYCDHDAVDDLAQILHQSQ